MSNYCPYTDKRHIYFSFLDVHLGLKPLHMYVYDTVSEAVNDLGKRGFTYNFKECDNGILCPELDLKLSPDKYKIKEIYRFEGFTDPADQAVVYAIESNDGIKGVIVNGYGIYTDPISDAVVSKLPADEKVVKKG